MVRYAKVEIPVFGQNDPRDILRLCHLCGGPIRQLQTGLSMD